KARILDREKITNITFFKKENGEILSDEHSASLIINWVGDVYELMGNGKGDYELLYEGDWIGYRIEVKQDKDRKSTRLNSSHVSNSYAVYCLKTKNTQ